MNEMNKAFATPGSCAYLRGRNVIQTFFTSHQRRRIGSALRLRDGGDLDRSLISKRRAVRVSGLDVMELLLAVITLRGSRTPQNA